MKIAVCSWLMAASLLTFIAYWRDKRAARAGAWRTPEATLLLLGLAGGWPGACLARHGLRHKTRKQPFRALFWFSVLANLALSWWLWRALAYPLHQRQP